jgi:hypothetical protein
MDKTTEYQGVWRTAWQARMNELKRNRLTDYFHLGLTQGGLICLAAMVVILLGDWSAGGNFAVHAVWFTVLFGAGRPRPLSQKVGHALLIWLLVTIVFGLVAAGGWAHGLVFGAAIGFAALLAPSRHSTDGFWSAFAAYVFALILIPAITVALVLNADSGHSFAIALLVSWLMIGATTFVIYFLNRGMHRLLDKARAYGIESMRHSPTKADAATESELGVSEPAGLTDEQRQRIKAAIERDSED